MNFIDTTNELKRPSTCYYLVVAIDGAWWIDVEGRPFGPCTDKDEAVGSAFRLIQVFGDTTRPAAIYAPNEDGRIGEVWRGSVDSLQPHPDN